MKADSSSEAIAPLAARHQISSSIPMHLQLRKHKSCVSLSQLLAEINDYAARYFDKKNYP